LEAPRPTEKERSGKIQGRAQSLMVLSVKLRIGSYKEGEEEAARSQNL